MMKFWQVVYYGYRALWYGSEHGQPWPLSPEEESDPGYDSLLLSGEIAEITLPPFSTF